MVYVSIFPKEMCHVEDAITRDAILNMTDLALIARFK